MMRVLVTGAAGFVGRHLISALKRQKKDVDITAWVLDEREAQCLIADVGAAIHIECLDITDEQQVKKRIADAPPQIVYHLAAQSSVGMSWKKPALTYAVNLVGTTHILEALREHAPNAKVLLIGSAEQYGTIREEELPVTEAHGLKGNNPYSVSKMAQEAAAQLYLENTQISIICIRAFNHIGPGQDVKFVIPDWCNQIVKMERNEIPPVLKVGNIAVKRDFTDVRDIVSAYILLSEFGQSGEIYNVGSGVSHSLEEMLNLICSCSVRHDISWETDKERLRPADTPELRADISKLKNTIGWVPKISLRQSIEDILNELRNR